MASLSLLPMPRHLELRDGTCVLVDGRLVVLSAPRPQTLLFAARRLTTRLHEICGLGWELVASSTAPRDQAAVALVIAPERVTHAQGYNLVVSAAGILIEAHDEAGVFYGVSTLLQIIEQAGVRLPCVAVSDWPDFPARGVMLDISRDKVPTMRTLYALVDMFAGWKLNQIQLYTENTFAYRHHPTVWANWSPMTGEQILALDAYCRERYVELVPNQNSFGHMERWLIHPRYAHLGEGGDHNWTLCPSDPASVDFLAGLFDELLPHFSSPLFNVGCDETQIGTGRSAQACAQRGEGRVYLGFLLRIYEEVRKRGRTMQFWGDIIMKHPELIPELPTDSVALEWGYEATHPFAEHGARFAASGIPFYVCPGTSSWNTLAGRTDNALGNILSAAENGLKNGAIGFLNTDWGDRGHWQALPVSYLGFAAGAAYAWAVQSNRAVDMAKAASVHAFRDPTGVMGRIAFDLGNVYKLGGGAARNASILFRILQRPLAEIVAAYPTLQAGDLQRSLQAIEQAVAPLEGVFLHGPDGDVIVDEFRNTARLMRHACRRGLLALESSPSKAGDLRRDLDLDMLAIVQDYCRIWLERNRSGGLGDSVRRLEQARADYGPSALAGYPC